MTNHSVLEKFCRHILHVVHAIGLDGLIPNNPNLSEFPDRPRGPEWKHDMILLLSSGETSRILHRNVMKGRDFDNQTISEGITRVMVLYYGSLNST